MTKQIKDIIFVGEFKLHCQCSPCISGDPLCSVIALHKIV